MTHFSLLVIGNDVGSQLEPFQEIEGNEQHEWDWFEVGGRWSGMIKLKEEDMNKQILNELEDKNMRVDSALKKDIANLEEIHTHALLKDGEWSESKMSWYGTGDNGEEKKWNKILMETINELPDDTRLSIIDCHIWDGSDLFKELARRKKTQSPWKAEKYFGKYGCSKQIIPRTFYDTKREGYRDYQFNLKAR